MCPPLQSIKIEKQMPVNAGEAVRNLEVLREGVGAGILALNRTEDVLSGFALTSLTNY